MTKPVYRRSSCCRVLKMYVYITIISIISFTNVLSERLTCKVVPFETKDGLTGSCCVFYKNGPNSSRTFPQEEITQIISSTNNDQNRNVRPAGPGHTDDAVNGGDWVFEDKEKNTEVNNDKNEQNYNNGKEQNPVMDQNKKNIEIGNDKNRQNYNNGNGKQQNPVVDQNKKNIEVGNDKNRQNDNNCSGKEQNPMVNQDKAPTPSKEAPRPETQKNVTLSNKNAFDTPEICPEGTRKDHAGGCTEPFT